MTDPRPHDFDGFETLGRIVVRSFWFVTALFAILWLFGGV